MFTQEAINQALTIWLGSAAIGLAFALIIAFLSQRGDSHADHGAHHEHENHGEHH